MDKPTAFSILIAFILLFGFIAETCAQALGITMHGVTQIQRIKCKNKSSGQSILLRKPLGASVDCEAAGLVVNTNDRVSISIDANAQGERPDAPSGLLASAGSSSILLRWQALAEAQSYTVYSADSAGVRPNNANRLATTANTTYIHQGLSPGTTFYYVVSASNASGEGMISKEVAVTVGGPFDHKVASGMPCAGSGCHDGVNLAGKSANHPATSEVCEACHRPGIWLPVILPLDHTQVIGSCVSCHFPGGVGSGKSAGHPPTSDLCEACHIPSNWLPLILPFDHSQTLGACSVCHNAAIATGKPPGHCLTTDDCLTCHTVNAWLPALTACVPGGGTTGGGMSGGGMSGGGMGGLMGGGAILGGAGTAGAGPGGP